VRFALKGAPSVARQSRFHDGRWMKHAAQARGAFFAPIDLSHKETPHA
jgi:hypothetical protein